MRRLLLLVLALGVLGSAREVKAQSAAPSATAPRATAPATTAAAPRAPAGRAAASTTSAAPASAATPPPTTSTAEPAPSPAASAAAAKATGAATEAGATAPPNPHTGGNLPTNPHTGMSTARDESEPDSSIPKGTIVARIVDGAGQPQPGITVRLGKMFQSIAEGDQRKSESKTTNANGEVSFGGLSTESAYSYRITVTRGPAEYGSTPFRLAEKEGQRVLLHVYPVTRDIAQARIAMRGLVYVQPRDDLFQMEVWFQVYNLGQVTWVPDRVSIDLPAGSKAFTARESMSDVRFELEGDERAVLLGTFSPGQHDVRFAFQVDNPQKESVSFDLSLPPHVGEFRVVAEAAKGMTLSARDYPPVQVSTGPGGDRVLVTQKRGQDLDDVQFSLGGLPTRGSAPWLAVLIAAVAAGSGVYVASNPPTRGRRRGKRRAELKQAKKVLLDELVQLESAKRDGTVGPKSYDRTRRALITALARVVQADG